jgi:hypothetical protein
MVIWPMCIVCWRPNASNTHSEYVALIDLPLQKWLPRALQCYIIRKFPVLLTLRCGILFVFLQYIIKEFNPSTHWLIISFVMYLLICVILHSVRYSGLRLIILNVISRLWTFFILRNRLPWRHTITYVKATVYNRTHLRNFVKYLLSYSTLFVVKLCLSVCYLWHCSVDGSLSYSRWYELLHKSDLFSFKAEF